jgi:hypothetical protein
MIRKSAAIELHSKYQRAKAVAMVSDAASVPVQCFEKSFLFQFAENVKSIKPCGRRSWRRQVFPCLRGSFHTVDGRARDAQHVFRPEIKLSALDVFLADACPCRPGQNRLRARAPGKTLHQSGAPGTTGFKKRDPQIWIAVGDHFRDHAVRSELQGQPKDIADSKGRSAIVEEMCDA